MVHLVDESGEGAAVGDPFAVTFGLLGGEAAGEGFAVQFAAVLVVRAVFGRGFGVTAAARSAADGVAFDHAAQGDEADVA